MAAGGGDILVFLAGERDIRDTESALVDHLGPRYTADGRARTPGAVEVVIHAGGQARPDVLLAVEQGRPQ